MKSVLTIAGAVLLALSGQAVAEAPLTSIRPEANPRLETRVATSGLRAPAGIALLGRLRPQARPASLAVQPRATLGAVGLAALQPRPRPAQSAPAPEPAVLRTPAPALPGLADDAPPARPGDLGEIEEVAYRTQPLPAVTTGRKGSVCGDRAIRGRTIPPIAAKMKGCGLEDGVEVTSVDGVPLSTPATLDCVTATALKEWVRDAVKPAVGRKGGGVARIEVAASYACRPRNNQKGAKVSEHGSGRAIDISGIQLANGEVISVLKHWGEGRAGTVLKKIRAAACGTFGTVLGPGSDRFHRDHLHLDTARYRSGAYCR